jgi:uncharacterized protein (TIRG00374 family)
MAKGFSAGIKKHLHKIVALFISLAILIVLYSKVDLPDLKGVFEKFSYFYFFLIMLSFVAIYLLAAWRWKLITEPYCSLSFFESLRQVASASSFNIILPSRVGSFAKAFFMTTNGHAETRPSISMVIYEKLSDLTAMSLIFVLAAVLHYEFNTLIIVTLFVSIVILLFYAVLHFVNIFNNSFVRSIKRVKIINKIVESAEVIYTFHENPDMTKSGLLKINSITLILWMVHITQIILFFYLIDLHVPVLTICTYMLCAIFVGLLPVSISGFGTRDLAIVTLFKGIITYNEALSIGILSAFRYIIPTLIGLPFFTHLMFSGENNTVSKKSSA